VGREKNNLHQKEGGLPRTLQKYQTPGLGGGGFGQVRDRSSHHPLNTAVWEAKQSIAMKKGDSPREIGNNFGGETLANTIAPEQVVKKKDQFAV